MRRHGVGDDGGLRCLHQDLAKGCHGVEAEYQKEPSDEDRPDLAPRRPHRQAFGRARFAVRPSPAKGERDRPDRQRLNLRQHEFDGGPIQPPQHADQQYGEDRCSADG